jgi:hypothetical protein
MSKHWQGCLLALTLVIWGSQLQAQESSARIAAIMRDMEARAAAAGQPMQLPEEPVVQVAAAVPMPQSVVIENAAGIPQHLLPEVYPSAASSYAVPQNVPAMSVQDFQSSWTGDRFMFSSAYHRRVNPPRGDFGNVPNDCGCCDEWQTFMPCESCCRDLGLNPWVIERARPNCPPNWWLHPNCNQECNDCNSGYGQPSHHGFIKNQQW